MRRKDREITDTEEIERFLDSCHVLRIGLCQGKFPYVVPLNFAFEKTKYGFVFYIHGALEGKRRKMSLENSSVCVECDFFGGYTHTAIGCSAVFESFIGFGEIADCNESEKEHALELLMKRSGKPLCDDDRKIISKTSVQKITVCDYSCKARKN